MLGHLWNLLSRSFQDFPTIISGNWLSILLPLLIFIIKEFGKLRDFWRDKNRWREMIAPVRRDFWMLVAVYVALFGLSVARAVYRDHEYLVGLDYQLQSKLSDAQKNVPVLSGILNQYSIARGKTDQDALVTVFATIYNRGTPSIADGFGLRIDTDSGKSAEGSFIPPPTEDKPIRLGEIGNPGHGVELSRKESLKLKATNQPIPYNGEAEGYAMFSISVPWREVLERDSIITLTFSDITGKTYTATHKITGKETGFVDLGNLQGKP